MCACISRDCLWRAKVCSKEGNKELFILDWGEKCNASQPSDRLSGIPAGPRPACWEALTQLQSSSFQVNSVSWTMFTYKGLFPLCRASMHACTGQTSSLVEVAFILSVRSSCWPTSFTHLWSHLVQVWTYRSPSCSPPTPVHCKGAAIQASAYFLPTTGLSIWVSASRR